MKNTHSLFIIIVILISSFALTTSSYSKGGSRGGHSGSGGDHSGSGRSSMGHSGKEMRSGSKGHGIHTTAQQRDHIRSCSKTADRVRTHAREMNRNINRRNYSLDKSRQGLNQLQKEYRTMQENHERFMKSLSTEQQEQIREQIRNMHQEREHANSYLQEMQNELNKSAPDRNKIAERSRNMEQAMKNWQMQYHLIDE